MARLVTQALRRPRLPQGVPIMAKPPPREFTDDRFYPHCSGERQVADQLGGGNVRVAEHYSPPASGLASRAGRI